MATEKTENLTGLSLCYNCPSCYGGDIGFDVDDEAEGACRGRSILVKRHYKTIVANDNNYRASNDYALAA